jgi:hypothetical protein
MFHGCTHPSSIPFPFSLARILNPISPHRRLDLELALSCLTLDPVWIVSSDGCTASTSASAILSASSLRRIGPSPSIDIPSTSSLPWMVGDYRHLT